MILQQKELKQLRETLEQARKRAVVACDEEMLAMIDEAIVCVGNAGAPND